MTAPKMFIPVPFTKRDVGARAMIARRIAAPYVRGCVIDILQPHVGHVVENLPPKINEAIVARCITCGVEFTVEITAHEKRY